jgi:hypothetical protein
MEKIKKALNSKIVLIICSIFLLNNSVYGMVLSTEFKLRKPLDFSDRRLPLRSRYEGTYDKIESNKNSQTPEDRTNKLALQLNNAITSIGIPSLIIPDGEKLRTIAKEIIRNNDGIIMENSVVQIYLSSFEETENGSEHLEKSMDNMVIISGNSRTVYLNVRGDTKLFRLSSSFQPGRTSLREIEVIIDESSLTRNLFSFMVSKGWIGGYITREDLSKESEFTLVADKRKNEARFEKFEPSIDRSRFVVDTPTGVIIEKKQIMGLLAQEEYFLTQA